MTTKSELPPEEQSPEPLLLAHEPNIYERSPITRDEMLSLVMFVSNSIYQRGQQDGLAFTAEWAANNNTDISQLKSFLESEHLYDDWTLIKDGDPYKLFGASGKRLAWMPLEREDLAEMITWLDQAVTTQGCAHDFTFAKKWLSHTSLHAPTTLMALIVKGGECDCKIAENVKLDEIYP